MNFPTTAASAQSQQAGAAAVSKARAAFDGRPWPELPRTARARVLMRIADAVEAGSERTIRIGDPLLPTTQMGPLISARQRDKVRALIDIGVAEGARLAAGGGVPDLPAPLRDGFFVEPTVLADATMDMTVARQPRPAAPRPSPQRGGSPAPRQRTL